MTQHQLRNALVITILVAFVSLLTLAATAHSKGDVGTATSTGPQLTHQQEIWQDVLEWCESRGVESAINPKDLDGTPSYYSYQFKPGTFRYYGEKYGLIATSTSDAELKKLMQDYQLEHAIVSRMILDKTIDWHQQFPWCIRKYGLPPTP